MRAYHVDLERVAAADARLYAVFSVFKRSPADIIAKHAARPLRREVERRARRGIRLIVYAVRFERVQFYFRPGQKQPVAVKAVAQAGNVALHAELHIFGMVGMAHSAGYSLAVDGDAESRRQLRIKQLLLFAVHIPVGGKQPEREGERNADRIVRRVVKGVFRTYAAAVGEKILRPLVIVGGKFAQVESERLVPDLYGAVPALHDGAGHVHALPMCLRGIGRHGDRPRAHRD